MGVEVRILGPLELTVDGRPVELRSGVQRTLLAALALHPGRPVRPDAIADVVWGDDPPPSARATLQAHLSRLRRLLAERGAYDVVVTRPEGYVLRADVDAAAFEAQVAQARAALREGEVGRAATLLRTALSAWRGAALPDVADRPDVQHARSRLETLRIEAAELRLRAELEAGRDVVAEAEVLVVEQPLRETAWAVLVRGLRRAGRDAEALHAYERARGVFAEELGVEPGPELRRLHAELLRADAAAGDAPAVRNNLPVPLTSFVGRTGDVASLVERVTTRRLVTIVGIGGAGKTRLAVETARAAAAAFPQGVWFVDLSAVSGPEQVAAAVAEAAGVRESSEEPLESRLATVLRDVRALVVLDNCEHLLDAAARLAARLLQSCPGLAVLATSRETLAVPGEVVHEVAGLALPEDDGVDDGGEAEALRLLTERAADAAPDVDLDRATALAVCRQLDGLPLAIEIVAPHLRTMPLADIADRLAGGFRLLAEGSRVAPDRHRTLEGAIEWSCGLIGEEERRLLGRLAVFPGSFSGEAAAAVCGDAELLPRLVTRSLLASEGDGRYRLLETVRAYARERLLDRAEPLRERLATWAEGLATDAEPHLTGPGQAAWLARLDAEQDNLRAALDVAHTSDERGAVARIAVPLLLFWVIRSRMIEARTWLDRAVAGCPEPGPLRLRALNALAVAHENVHGPSAELDAVLAEARELAAALDDDLGAAWNACWSGMVAVWGDLDTARDELHRARDLFAGAAGGAWGGALAGAYLAFVERLRGEYEEAERVAVAAEEAFDALGERWGGALCRTTRGVLARQRVELPLARTLFEGSLEVFLDLDSPDGAVICLQGLALVAGMEDDLEAARDLFVRALELARRAGSVTHVAENLTELGWIGVGRDDPDEAMRWLREFADDPSASRYDRCLASALDLAGQLLAPKDPDAAARLLGAATTLRIRLGEEPRPEHAARLAAVHLELERRLGGDGLEAGLAAGGDAEPLDELRAVLRSSAGGPRPRGDAPTG